ncbi:MAG: D-sedoheptulose 7-phosphate isomerase [Bacteroidetes bacterium]|nr:D-sedoheptulose 7-phosphate isomerase [Bacteroidota bacterium]MCW5894061.1 D-sedoheptulose 7-phosphate isomerase [Bacteroidota bacterium]
MAHLPVTILARQAFVQDELFASADTKKKIFDQCTDKIIKAVDVLINALNNKKKILLCGNGGSAADSQHLATEFTIRMNPNIKRPGIAALALTTDSSMLTAGANDIGYDNVFARAVEALGNSGDVLIGISTSGKSESVNNAFRMARSKGMATIGLLGKDGGSSKDLCDVAIIVPSSDTQRIQEGHITIGHILCGLVETEMYG